MKNSIFIELDYCKPNNMACAIDIEKLSKRTDKDQVYTFFIGLDRSLDEVSSRALATSL